MGSAGFARAHVMIHTMYTRWPLALAVLLLFVGMNEAATASKMTDDAQAICAEEWPRDLDMQRSCVHEMLDGIEALLEFADYFGIEVANGVARSPTHPAAADILNLCVERWRDTQRGRVDYRMAHWCLKRQLDAGADLGTFK